MSSPTVPVTASSPPTAPAPVWRDLEARALDGSTAIHRGGAPGAPGVSWCLLARRTLQVAAALHAAGVRGGHRVSLLVEPGPARTAVTYACWRVGAVVVVADPTMPRRDRLRAHEAARPDVVVADGRGLLLTRGLRTPFLRLATRRTPLSDLALGVDLHLADLVTRHLLLALPGAPDVRADAALVFAGPGTDHPPQGVLFTQTELARLRATGRPTPGSQDQLRSVHLAAALVVPAAPAGCRRP